MALAFVGPISGSLSSSSADAVLMLIFVPGAIFSEEEEGDFLEGEEGSVAAEVLPVDAAPPAAAPAAAGAVVSSTFEELFFFVSFLSAVSSLAATPSLSFRTFLSESSFLPVPTPLTFETSSHVL